MARVIFWDVDTQYDFMKPDGKLYVPDAAPIIPNLERLSDYAHGHGIREIASADDNVMYGVATDLVDKAAVEGLLEHRPHTRLFVVTDAVKGIDKNISEQLLKEWGEEGVRLVKTKEVVEEGLVEELARATA